MGFVEFMIFSIVVVALAWLGTMAVGQIPGCPAIVPKIFWGIAIIIILIMLANATGVLKYDPKIPHV